MDSKRLIAVCLVATLGILLGLGFYTLKYAKGFSYLSSDPKVCANCHIMQPQYDSWIKSSHHAVASCVDCHLPHGLLEKYWAKVENGYFHSRAFTMQDFQEPIRITRKNAHILERNCLHCHQEMVSEMLHTGNFNQPTPNCVHCHSNAGHGEQAVMGKIDQEKFYDPAKMRDKSL